MVFASPVLHAWCSLVDTSVVGTRSARELAALGPGTQMCDGNAYVFTFLAAASTPVRPPPHPYFTHSLHNQAARV